MSTAFLIGFGVLASILVIVVLMLIASYKKVPNNHSAMIVNGLKHRIVTFNGAFIFPRINTKEVMDISVKTIELNRKGVNSLSCKDNIRADLEVSFYIGVNPTAEDVLAVAQAIGAENTTDVNVLKEHFLPKFSEAVKTVGKQFEFQELYHDRDEFNEKICAMLEGNMDGFRLQRVAIDYLEQTPLRDHSDDNIQDVEGIRKITEITAAQNILTHRLQQDEIETKKKREVEKEERVLQLVKQENEAKARTDREIAVIRAQETAATKQEEEAMTLKTEEARIAREQKVEIEEVNKSREIEATRLNNERVLVEEREVVERAALMQKVQTEEAVQLRQIDKDKKAEAGNKEVADIKSERVAIERKITIEEEETRDISNKSQADRAKLTAVTAATAKAETDSIAITQKASAEKEAATHQAEQRKVLAAAEKEEADLRAAAKERLATATEAELAASGLAEAKVKVANAEAVEKNGMAEAKTLAAKGEAQAKSAELLGVAEAKSIDAKAEAMVKMNESGMEFEKMDREFKLEQARIEVAYDADVKIAGHQASVMAAALKESNIDIVGGSTEFFEHMQKMVTKGKGIDAFVNKSKTVGTVASEYLDGDRSLPEDLTHILASLSTGDIAKMSVADFLQSAQGKSLLGMLKPRVTV